jgi:hypothetical protein
MAEVLGFPTIPLVSRGAARLRPLRLEALHA